jgi:branched-chain amino acid transport system ATP-binding protein
VSFGGVMALNSVSFDVSEREIFSVIGPNGAGKTTLFNVLTGIYAPTAGDIRYCGERINDYHTHARAALGIHRTFQNLQTFHDMTVLENVMVGAHLQQKTGFAAAVAGLPAVRRENARAARHAHAWLETFGLQDVSDSLAGTLPYGKQKKLEIARALAAKPRLLLLDEPAAGLNAAERIEIAVLIRRIAAEHTTVVLVEHDMKLVMGISDRILVLNFGEPLACGTAKQVAGDPKVLAAYLGPAVEKADRAPAH